MDALNTVSAVITGGSSGGFAARGFAIDYPNRIKGLVFLGSPFVLRDKQGVQELWETTISKLTDPIDPGFVREFQMSTITQPVPEAFIFYPGVGHAIYWEQLAQVASDPVALVENIFPLRRIHPELYGLSRTGCRSRDQPVGLQRGRGFTINQPYLGKRSGYYQNEYRVLKLVWSECSGNGNFG